MRIKLLSKSTVFTIFALVLIGVGLVLGWNDAPGTMAAAVVSGLGFLCFAHLDQLSEFKASASGIEAKTRKLDATVNKAQNTIQELRSLALIMSKTVLSLAIRHGRLCGYGDDNIENLIASVRSVLNELGLSETDIKAVTEDVEKFTRHDYVACITGSSTISYVPKDMVAERNEFLKFPESTERSSDELRAFMEKAGQLTPTVEELIKDYEHYCRYAEHRRPEVFKIRQQWGERHLQIKQ